LLGARQDVAVVNRGPGAFVRHNIL
jgi:hypothetical protein